jgi:MraZ protein
VVGIVGHFGHTLDDKGRLTLPVRFRTDFSGTVHLTNYYEGCVAVWTPGEFDRQVREILALHRQGTRDARNQSRVWSDGSSAVDVDKQGRLVIPQGSRQWGDLSGEVTILGAIDHLEIWNPARYDELVAPSAQFFNGTDLVP